VNVVSLVKERERRDGPDPQHLMPDDGGRLMARYACQFRMNDRTWCESIWAYSTEDAEARVVAMRESLVVCGQIYAEV
jgi:hypothetical protein